MNQFPPQAQSSTPPLVESESDAILDTACEQCSE